MDVCSRSFRVYCVCMALFLSVNDFVEIRILD